MRTYRKVRQEEKSIFDRIIDYFAALYAVVVGKFTAMESSVIVCKLTVKVIIWLVKDLRTKGAVKTLVADVNSMIAECTSSNSVAELKKLKQQGITHIVAGVDRDGKLVDGVQLLQNEDDEAADEVVELLGDEGMVIIEG